MNFDKYFIEYFEFDPKGPINETPSVAEIMVWRRPGAKPLAEQMVISLLAHICNTQPQWAKTLGWKI